MTKQEFLDALQAELSGLPTEEIQERLTFYGEMIDDRIEDGVLEEDAISGIGSVREIARQILSEVPFSKLAKERIKPKKQKKTWVNVLLAAGSPIWVSLGIAAFSVLLSLYVALWAMIVSLWAVFASLCAASVGGAASGIFLVCSNRVPTGLAMIAATLVCIGLGIFLFFGSRAATKGILRLSKKMVFGIKKSFVKKEAAK